MRDYELVLVINPELDETALTDLVNKIQSWITDAAGEVIKIDLWGKRKLAYQIRKHNEGQYVLFNTKMDPKTGVLLERNLGYTEPVMRYLLIVKE